MRLYNYPRSSASIRVRAALAHKGLPYESLHVDLHEGGQHDPTYLAVNPQRLIPTLVDDEVTISQSMAILEYLEERYPERPLLPADLPMRARVRSVCQFVVADMQPINTLRIGQYLASALGASPEQVRDWRLHWLEVGFTALDAQLGARFAVGEALSLADLCVYAQTWYAVANLGLALERWPRVEGLYARLGEVEAIRAALP